LFQGIVLPSSLGSNSPGLLDPEDEGIMTLHMSGTTYPVTQRHLPEDMNPQQHFCKNLKSCMSLPSPNVVGRSFSLYLLEPSHVPLCRVYFKDRSITTTLCYGKSPL